jgi:hypothetical protein
MEKQSEYNLENEQNSEESFDWETDEFELVVKDDGRVVLTGKGMFREFFR